MNLVSSYSPSLSVKLNSSKLVEGNCYRPDWCNCTQDQFLYEKAMCLSMALFNYRHTAINKGTRFSKLGMVKEANKVYFELNRINYIISYLFLVYTQVYLNQKDSVYNYITCDELEKIKKELNCIGFDISCIYECLDLCDYNKTCNNCKNDTSRNR